MSCDICRFTVGHHSQCPNYEFPLSDTVCDICDEPVLYDEEFIENENGKIAHWDCIYSKYELLEWLGLGIKTMNDEF